MSSPLECFFLGTGTSTGLPLTPCLTLTSDYPASINSAPSSSKRAKGTYDPKGPWPRDVKCGSCRSAVDPDVPEGWKNRRGNTSMIVRKRLNGKWFNVVLDVGKTFRENAVKYFPVWGVKTIDAVILTHGRELLLAGYTSSLFLFARDSILIP